MMDDGKGETGGMNSSFKRIDGTCIPTDRVIQNLIDKINRLTQRVKKAEEENLLPFNLNDRFSSEILGHLASKSSPDRAVNYIYENISEFRFLLHSKPEPKKYVLLWNISVRIQSSSLVYKRNEIYSTICSKEFVNYMTKNLPLICLWEISRSEKLDLLQNLLLFFQYLFDNSLLTKTVDAIENLISLSSIVVKTVGERLGCPSDLIEKIEKLKSNLEEPDALCSGVDQLKLGCDEEPPDDYRLISLYPVPLDFKGMNFLRENIVDGPYKDVKHYLDVQFRLLREDFMFPLREGLQYYRASLDASVDNTTKRNYNVHIYRKVRILTAVRGTRNSGDLAYRIELDKNYCNRIKWENSKRLLFGSLVLLSKNNFNSFQLGIVSDRSIRDLRRGSLSVIFVGKNVYGSEIYSTNFVMAESDAFFEPVYQTLRTIQRLPPSKLPMKKYLLVHDVTSLPPAYIDQNKSIRLQGLEVTVNDDSTWPSAATLELNEPQYAALKASFRQEFVVIEGPPGTGKTFLALKIIDVLLRNFTFNSPILMLAYTNHALDQFLEGILKFTDRVVRIGGQGNKGVLEKYNFNNIKQRLIEFSCSKKRRMRSRSDRHGNVFLTEEEEDLEFELEEELFETLPGGVAVKWPDDSNPFVGGLKSEMNECYYHILLETETIKVIEKCDGLINVIPVSRTYGLTSLTQLMVWLFGDTYISVAHLFDDSRKSIKMSDLLNEALLHPDSDDEESFRRMNNSYEYDEVLLMTSMGTMHHELKKRVPLRLSDLDRVIDKLNAQLLTSEENTSTTLEVTEITQWIKIVEEIKCKMSEVLCFDKYDNQVEADDLSSLTSDDKWTLYHQWVQRIKSITLNKLEFMKYEYTELLESLKGCQEMDNIKLLTKLRPRVIGMTTTGAARLHDLLSSLQPEVVIVEEAGEVMEAHIVSSLTQSCQHLILIGDHKQLRPSTCTYELSRKYHMDVSLFERMVRNNVGCNTLNIQHRMKPNIASLITPVIYPQLFNHASVEDYPPVLGVTKNLFFIDHQFPEEKGFESESCKNPHEAEFMIALCRHLLLQGYKPSDITILTTYASQLYHMRELKKKQAMLEDVRITVVDNFQGEESKIILLSLVRSNEESRIGYLGTQNRICVALSRAKHGLYIIGNMSNLKSKSRVWQNIDENLQNQEAIGDCLTLCCQIHGVETKVKNGKDFKVLKNGGCTAPCPMSSSKLSCGHPCQKLCHPSDTDHKYYLCPFPCLRTKCEDPARHACLKPCFAECFECTVEVPKVVPSCGHTVNIPCSEDPGSFNCNVMVDRTLRCGHIQKVKCSSLNPICLRRCGRDLPCGHKCLSLCDSGSCTCSLQVQKTLEKCGHVITVPCYNNDSDVCTKHYCKKKLDCGHHCVSQCGHTSKECRCECESLKDWFEYKTKK